MKKLYRYNLVALLKTNQMKREKPTVLQQKEKNTIIGTSTMLNITEKFSF